MTLRRLLTGLVATVALAGTGAGPAEARWSSFGIGLGSGVADTLGAGNQPTVSAAGQAVTVSWTQTTFRGAPLGAATGGGYTVMRYPAAGGAGVIPGGTCAATTSGAAATLSCVETSVPTGSWRYAVKPVLGSWTGVESATSAVAASAVAVPTLSSVVAQDPAAGQTTGTIQVTWAASAGATGYNVYRRTGSGAYDYAAPLNGATPVTATTFTDPASGLTGGTSYSYVVRAVAGAAASADSNERSATAVARPAAPTGTTATRAPAGRITVAWTSVAGATGYNVFRRLGAAAYNYAAPLNGATPVTAATFSDTTSVGGSTYRYVVRAVGPGAGAATLESADGNETPAVTADSTVPTAVSMTDPGTPLRGPVTLTGAATDAGSGVASVRFDYAPAGTTTWLTACTATVSPYSCSFATAGIPDGLYDLRATATDVAGNAASSATVANRRIDNSVLSVTVTDPGAYLRGMVSISATPGGGPAPVASVTFQGAPAGSGTWTSLCNDTASPYTCTYDTSLAPDGSYDIRAIVTDTAGATATSPVLPGRVVDNTAPTATDIQAVNGAGIAGRPTAGDVVTWTFSEAMAPATLLAGWNGSSIGATVRFSGANPGVLTVFNGANTTQVALGSVNLARQYFTAAATFTGSTMVSTGAKVTVTLGSTTSTATTATGTPSLAWTPSSAATDLAGNPATTATATETGVADLDF